MDAELEHVAPGWEDWLKWARLYGWLVIGGALYGIAAAHVPFLIGDPWTSCQETGLDCVLAYHLFEVPVVVLIGGVGVFAVRSLTWESRLRFFVLLMVAMPAMLVFLLFETIQLLENFARQAPSWESWALVSIALVLLVGVTLGLKVAAGLTDFISVTSAVPAAAREKHPAAAE